MSTVTLVVPAGIDDPARVSGGNRYDRRARDGLRAAGWTVAEIAADGAWPQPDGAARQRLADALDDLDEAALVLVDGMIAVAARDVLVPRAARLRVVVLLHMLFGGNAVEEDDEAAVLRGARAVVATSDWTRTQLLRRYALAPSRVHVARPGGTPAPVSPPSTDGGRLLCVGALTPVKGQDVLLDALGAVPDLPWHCTLVGPADRDPAFAASLERRIAGAGLAGRVRLAGTCTGAALRREYLAADLLVVPSRAETYGMVVTEALAAGIPVLASAIGGLPEALGHAVAGVPGLLVPPGDAGALAAALVRWLTDDGLRRRLRARALQRRPALPGWRETTGRLAGVLAAAGAEPDRRDSRGAR